MRRKIIYVLGLLAVTFITSSCLKDNFGEDWTSSLKGKMYAQFVRSGFQANTIAFADSDQFVNVLINIASDDKPSSENTITVAIDIPALSAYDTVQFHADTTFKSYIPYPGATIVNPQVIVPAGSRVAYVRLKLSRADTLRTSEKYMVPITITAATNGIIIAENMKTALVAVPIANQYEGDYASTGRIHKLTGWDRTWSSTKHLFTVDANTVSYLCADIGLPCNITIDPVTNKVTTFFNTDLTYDFQFNTPDLNLDGQGGDSRWDPATKTFYLYYYYIGTGALARVATEKLVMK